MLKRFRVHNFRSFLNFEVNFSPLHLIIGKNNSGKTNLARAIHFLGWTATSSLGDAVTVVPGGFFEFAHRGLRQNITTFSCTCELEFEGALTQYVYDLALRHNTDSAGQPELVVVSEKLVADAPNFANATLLENDGAESRMLHESLYDQGLLKLAGPTLSPRNATMLSKLYQLPDNRRAILFRNFISMWAYYSLSPRQMRHGWQDAKDSVSLYQLGDNLANAIYHLKNQDELSYRRIVERAQVLEPDLRAINFVPTPGQAPVPFIQLKDSSRGSWIGLSDGTLRVLGFATIIEQNASFAIGQSGPRSVVLIEEPENGIAPAYLRQVFEFFENVGRSQFIFTSHSPYFIDLFDAERSSVTLLTQKDGHSSIVPLSSGQSNSDMNNGERLTLADLYASELL